MEEEEDEEAIWKEVEKSIDISNLVKEEAPNDDLATLTRQLLNEQASPVLLPYVGLNSLKKKVDKLMNKALSEDLDPLESSILEMEAKRIEFELVSLHRLRLLKIIKYSKYLRSEMNDRLSLLEKEFGTNYSRMKHEYFSEVFLSQLPDTFEDEDKELKFGGFEVDIYPKPHLQSHVAFRANIDLSQVFTDIQAGQTWACPFSEIESHVISGDATLI